MSFSGYIPVDTAQQEIRLVTVEPAKDDDLPIKCTLSFASLKEFPEFTALSYVWGDASITRPNRKTFYDTENLFHALVALRWKSKDFVCWIDAICINQKYTSEKNSQVLLMGEIYQASRLLIVWLGDESNDSNLACSLTVKWGEAHMKFVNEHPGLPQTVEDFQGRLDEVGPNAFDAASWDALDKLFGRPWWQRIWVLQEFAQARLRVFWCESRVFDSNILLHTWALWDGLKEAPTVLMTVALQAAGILFRYSSAESAALFSLWDFDRPLPLFAFLKILYQTRTFRSTDLKDKLYGIIGLVSFVDCQIKPHYEWSRQQICTDLFLKVLETSKKLQLMSLSGISSAQEGHTCTLPSWVPHLDCDMSAVGMPYEGYKAAGDSMAEAYISQNSLSLFAKGLFHSSVLVIHLFARASYPEDLDERISFLPNNLAAGAFEHIKACLKLSRRFIKGRYPTGDTVLLALFCLLTEKDPTDRSSVHLICGYLDGFNVAINESPGPSFDKRLLKSGVTEHLHQTVDDAFWGSREQPSVFTEGVELYENVPPFLEAAEQALKNAQ